MQRLLSIELFHIHRLVSYVRANYGKCMKQQASQEKRKANEEMLLKRFEAEKRVYQKEKRFPEAQRPNAANSKGCTAVNPSGHRTTEDPDGRNRKNRGGEAQTSHRIVERSETQSGHNKRMFIPKTLP